MPKQSAYTVWLRCEVEAESQEEAERVLIESMDDVPAAVWIEQPNEETSS